MNVRRIIPITSLLVSALALPARGFGQEASPPPPPPPANVYAMPPPGHHGLFGDSGYRSPGLSVALSLTPLPIDFGNLHAENLGWGIAYTAIEVSLMAPMMWVVGGHMGHGGVDDRRWSDGERGAMIGLLTGYVAVKLVSGLHAGYAASAYNRRYDPRAMAFVLPTRGGGIAGAWVRF